MSDSNMQMRQNMVDKPHLMTKKDTAEFIGVSERTLDRWHLLRKGPPRITLCRRILYRLEAVVTWLESNEAVPIRRFRDA